MSAISILRGFLGILLILGIAFLFSNNKKRISWSLVGKGLLIQFIFAIFIIHGEKLRSWFFILGWPKDIVNWIGGAVITLLKFITEGSKFVFGNLAVSSGSESLGYFFAFQALPAIIFFASLTAVLYYLGILQTIVEGMAYVMSKILGTSGAESLSNTANIFIGQTEAPILIRPYLGTMTKSELLTIMVGGMATVAGGVMAIYIQMLGQAMAEVHKMALQPAQLKFAVHLITASVMAAPASIVIAKILYPETKEPKTRGTVKLKVEKTASNVIEAAASGASEGMKLALNVGAMLIAFIAFVYFINYFFLMVGTVTGINTWLIKQFGQPLSMQLVLGVALKYLAIGIGVPAQDAFKFGSLFGTKIVLNEFVAYIDLVNLIKEGALSEKGIIMSTYALCGFANFASVAIQIGGISPMAPHRRKDISALGMKAVLGGSLVTLLTATLAGVLLG